MSSRRSQIALVGLGGQGVVFLARAISEAAMRDGSAVISSEEHGMGQRGGAVEATVKIGAFAGPTIRAGRADLVIVLDPRRAGDGRAYLRAGGVLVESQGGARSANVAALGAAVARAGSFLPSAEALRRAVAKRSADASREENLRRFDEGISRAASAA